MDEGVLSHVAIHTRTGGGVEISITTTEESHAREIRCLLDKAWIRGIELTALCPGTQ